MLGRIVDAGLAGKGEIAFEWARARMPIIGRIVSEQGQQAPLAGLRLGLCLHVTKETSVLAMAAKQLGAEVSLCSANPLSCQDDVAAFLFEHGVSVFAWRGESRQEYEQCIRDVIAQEPMVVTDDGGDLHIACHNSGAAGILGGTEETTSGVKRLAALAAAGMLAYPVVAVNNARTKHLFDNRYGTGQSVLDGIIRATSVLLAGTRVVVCGYGWVGKGVASRARGMGAIVTVTEADPVRALEARMDGFSVARLSDVAPYGDIFITCTGQRSVIRKEHMEKMKEGAVLANAGHFDVEVDARFLYSECGPATEPRPGVERFLVNGRKIYLLSKGRVVNLVQAEGNPPEVMALSFANQLLSILYIARSHRSMERRLQDVPAEIDNMVANYALESMGIRIDSLTADQLGYRNCSLG